MMVEIDLVQLGFGWTGIKRNVTCKDMDVFISFGLKVDKLIGPKNQTTREDQINLLNITPLKSDISKDKQLLEDLPHRSVSGHPMLVYSYSNLRQETIEPLDTNGDTWSERCRYFISITSFIPLTFSHLPCIHQDVVYKGSTKFLDSRRWFLICVYRLFSSFSRKCNIR